MLGDDIKFFEEGLSAEDRTWLQLRWIDWIAMHGVNPRKDYCRIYEWMRDDVKNPMAPPGAVEYLRLALANRVAEKLRGY
jgi:hypothetical protein